MLSSGVGARIRPNEVAIGVGENKIVLLDLGRFNFNQHKYMIGVYSHIVLMAVGLVVSYLFNGKPADDSLTYYGWLKLKRENKRTE